LTEISDWEKVESSREQSLSVVPNHSLCTFGKHDSYHYRD